MTTSSYICAVNTGILFFRALFGYVKADKNTTVDYSEAGIHVVSTDALLDLNLEPACDSDCLERNVARLTENKYHKGWIVSLSK